MCRSVCDPRHCVRRPPRPTRPQPLWTGEGDPAELARLEERLAQLQQQAQQKSWRLKVLIDRCRGMLDSLNMWETSQQALAAGS